MLEPSVLHEGKGAARAIAILIAGICIVLGIAIYIILNGLGEPFKITRGSSTGGNTVISFEEETGDDIVYLKNGVTYRRAWISDDNSEIFPSDDTDFVIKVNLALNIVTVYHIGGDWGEVAVRNFYCSSARPGNETPEGTYSVSEWLDWCLLEDGSFGQYAYRIEGTEEYGYMFHSVPYITMEKGNLEWAEFDKLGSPASLGCIRCAVEDVRWLCRYVGSGSKIIIYSDPDDPGPLGYPEKYFIPEDVPQVNGWDPTDPDPENPWRDYDITLDVPSSEIKLGIFDKGMDITNFASASDSFGNDLSRYITYTVNGEKYGFGYDTIYPEDVSAARRTNGISQSDLIKYNNTTFVPETPGEYEVRISMNIGLITAVKTVSLTVTDPEQ